MSYVTVTRYEDVRRRGGRSYRRLTQRFHAVQAAGGHLDGILYGFSTLCGLLIDEPLDWFEWPGHAVDCKSCIKSLTAQNGKGETPQ